MPSDIRLKEFQIKSSPTPEDIVYMGNTADDFNEVRATISALIAAYPILQSMAALTLNDGQLIIGSSASPSVPVAANLVAGTGIVINNSSGGITISTSGGGFSVETIAGTTQTADVETLYIALNSGQTTVTLPSTFAVGNTVSIIGSNANTGGWILQAASGDTIMYNGTATSPGGTLTSSSLAGQTIEVICDVENSSWVVVDTVNTTLTTA